MGALSRSAIEINDGAGLVESLNNTGANGSLCGGFTIRAKTSFSAWETLQTTVKVRIKGQEVVDAYGKTFPDFVSNSTLNHRCALLDLLPCAVSPTDSMRSETWLSIVLVQVQGCAANSVPAAGQYSETNQTGFSPCKLPWCASCCRIRARWACGAGRQGNASPHAEAVPGT